MSQTLQAVLSANDVYAADFGDKGNLPMPPGRRFAVLTCMDARLDPAKFAGLSEGDAHVIRNAGGRASDDAIRSLVISYKLLGKLLVIQTALVQSPQNPCCKVFTETNMQFSRPTAYPRVVCYPPQ